MVPNDRFIHQTETKNMSAHNAFRETAEATGDDDAAEKVRGRGKFQLPS